jgi:dihydrofolate synthase/folylpolyglutamate synthase
LPEIAAEKAGILKAGVDCVMAAQSPAAAGIIQARADELGAPLLAEGDGWAYQVTDAGFTVTTRRRTLNLPAPGLVGVHQTANAAQAIAILDQMDATLIPEAAVAEGIASARWPARLQQLNGGKLARILPDGWELWLDGGHNAAAGQVLAAQAAAWIDKPLYLIAGILNSKDPSGFLGPLATHAAKLLAVAIPGEEASLGAEDVASLASGLGLEGEAMPSVEAAIAALGRAPRGRILICGSLYLAGYVLGQN